MKRNGAFLEEIINNSLKIINNKNLGFFIKSPTPNKVIPINGKYTFIYSSKALCDFIGIFNKKFILIECKEISGKFFDTTRLKKHQLEHLNKIFFNGGFSFLFFYLKNDKTIVALSIEIYNVIINSIPTKRIKIEQIIKNGFCFKEIIKGTIDILNFFKNYINQ